MATKSSNHSNRSVVTAIILAIAVILISVASASAATKTSAKPASIQLLSPVSKTVEVGDTWNVRWNTTNYPSRTVSVNIIKKVGSNPDRYELIRTIATSTANDKKATWVVANSDMGSNISLEIGCAKSRVACIAGNNTGASLAVVNTGRNANTAAAYKAIEWQKNK